MPFGGKKLGQARPSKRPRPGAFYGTAATIGNYSFTLMFDSARLRLAHFYYFVYPLNFSTYRSGLNQRNQ